MNSDDNFSSAVMSRAWPKVLKLYEEKKELRTAKITAKGDTALHKAVSCGKEHVVKSMVDLVCRDKIKEQDKESLVDENGDEKNLVLGAQNEEGNTPLHLAALMGSVEMCEEISHADPLLIAKRNKAGETPLFLAALHGNKRAFLGLDYQYRSCPEVSSTDFAHCIERDNQDTIFHLALQKERIDFVIEIANDHKYHLKEMMVRRNKDGNTPLHLAASIGSVEVCEKISDTDPLLIAERNKAGETPLFLAALHGKQNAFLCLYDKYRRDGASSIDNIAHCLKRDNQDTILHLALEDKRMDFVIEIVNDHKYPLKEMMVRRNKDGNTPLHLAASIGSVEVCEKISYTDPLLIAERNKAGETPLFLAAFHGKQKAFLCLYDKYRRDGASSTDNIAHCLKRDNQDTILHLALEEKRMDFVIDIVNDQKYPLKEMVTMCNKEGNTPLHLAASIGSVEVCEKISDTDPLLIAERNKAGETPLFLAALYGKQRAFLCLYDKCRRDGASSTDNIAHCLKRDNQDTILHLALEEKRIDFAIDIISGYKYLLEEMMLMSNKEGNTPLHLAASIGSVEVCKKISDTDPLLIAERNKAGETPLFLAALHGKQKAFLCLYDKYTKSHGVSSTDIAHCIKRNNQDTILHCALEKKQIDLAIDIVFLYKDHLGEMTRMRNRNGLSPLHLLAETPSIFESTDLPYQSFIDRLLYHWTFLRVKKKKQLTTLKELEEERKPCFEALMFSLRNYALDRVDDLVESSSAKMIVNIIVMLLCWLAVILLIPLAITETWFHGRGKMEKYAWSLQIVDELLQHVDDEYMTNPYVVDSEERTIRVETPLMIAAQNGVIEMVEKILLYFPSTVKGKNEEGKNIVLIAAEKRQTKVYQILCENKNIDKSAFRQVDKDGNTALLLAVNLNWQATTLVDQVKWFEFVKYSVPSELRKKHNKSGKTAEEIFRAEFEKQMTKDREWLNQTSQACSVVSTVVASMAFSNVTNDSDAKTHHSSLVSLSMSLTSTIILLTIVSVRSQSLKFWIYLPFMLHAAISLMLGSIASLWISLMVRHGKSLTTYAILGSPIAIFSLVSTRIFIGPALKSMFTKVPPPNRNTRGPIHYRRTQKKEFDENQKRIERMNTF